MRHPCKPNQNNVSTIFIVEIEIFPQRQHITQSPITETSANRGLLQKAQSSFHFIIREIGPVPPSCSSNFTQVPGHSVFGYELHFFPAVGDVAITERLDGARLRDQLMDAFDKLFRLFFPKCVNTKNDFICNFQFDKNDNHNCTFEIFNIFSILLQSKIMTFLKKI